MGLDLSEQEIRSFELRRVRYDIAALRQAILFLDGQTSTLARYDGQKYAEKKEILKENIERTKNYIRHLLATVKVSLANHPQIKVSIRVRDY